MKSKHVDDHALGASNEPTPITAYKGRKKKRPPIDPTTVSTILPPPTNPMAVGRKLLERHVQRGIRTLRHWRGGWWTWMGSHWIEREDRAVKSEAYEFTENAVFLPEDEMPKGDVDSWPNSDLIAWMKALQEISGAGLEPWQPTRFKIGNLLEAFAAIVHLDETIDQPSWIDVDGLPVVATANGLLRIDSRELLPHTPLYFNQTAVPFDYDANARPPAAWLAFLDELWPDDPESIATLQEFLGYVVSGRLDLHKILLIVGPTRGGKGTIARILGKLVGPANVAGPTLSGLTGEFGMAPLIGKSLAVISDARLSGKKDSSVVVERLLAISGEDTITVNRKNKDQWTGKLPCRFLVISNELPKLGDDSGTIANRFVVLLLRESWLGREDHGLEDRLTGELTGILNWALDGLDRLAEQDRFTRPASTDEAILALQDLASPVAAFVREQCVTGPTHGVPVEALFKAWQAWAEDHGESKVSASTFGRNLRSVVPFLRVARPGERDDRVRIYRGIGFRDVQPTVPGSVDPRGPEGRGPAGSTDTTTVTRTQTDTRGITVSEEMARIFEAKTSSCRGCGQGIVWHPDRSAWIHAAPSDHAPELTGGES